MKTTTVKLTLPGHKGAAYAMYEDGVLVMLINEIVNCQLSIINYAGKDFERVELTPKTVSEKVAMFCLLYKKHKAIPYRASKQEKANLKLVTVNEHLLNTYFTHTSYPLTHTKTMADYVRHYNTVRDLAANGVPQKKSAFPDVYDKLYERTISDDITKLQRYWAHLREQGWRKTDGVWSQEAK
jgi:hypothetical protein